MPSLRENQGVIRNKEAEQKARRRALCGSLRTFCDVDEVGGHLFDFRSRSGTGSWPWYEKHSAPALFFSRLRGRHAA